MKRIVTTAFAFFVATCFIASHAAAVGSHGRTDIAAQSLKLEDSVHLAQASTWHLCLDTATSQSLIIPGGNGGNPRYNCTNMFFGLSGAMGMACFHISNGTGSWPQTNTAIFGIVITC